MMDANSDQPMPGSQKCPQCGTMLPAGVLGGLCPACLLKQGGMGDSTQGSGRAFTPPSVEDVARLFPQFDILAFIGKGGMGAVYKARQKQLDRIVALKILPPGIGDDPAFAERFTREAKALARLNHPGIVTLYEFGSQPSGSGASPLYYFLMEFVDGVNLRQLLNNGRISPREALAIVPQICDALQFAHDQGIVHRDIKPENVLLDRRGRVKVADFGLAKLVGQGNESAVGEMPAAGSPSLTEAGKIVGTPQYMAPEQAAQPGEVDHRADIYALGVVFYQMLTGELPGKRLEPPSRKVEIDVRLDEVVLRALEKEPEQRYQQVSVLKTQVETIASSPDAWGRFTGRDQRSKQTIFGIPLVHVAWGTDPATGKPRVARGIIAVGSVAVGVIAVGFEAYGILASGLFAIGLLSVGLFALGLAPSGILSVGLWGTGLLAIGGQVVGLVAAGLNSVGLASFGRHAVGALKPEWNPKILLAVLGAGLLAGLVIRHMIKSSFKLETKSRLLRPALIASVRVLAFVTALALLVLFLARIGAGIERYDVWHPQTIAYTDNPNNAVGTLQVTDARQDGQLAIFNFVYEPLRPTNEVKITFRGPRFEQAKNERTALLKQIWSANQGTNPVTLLAAGDSYRFPASEPPPNTRVTHYIGLHFDAEGQYIKQKALLDQLKQLPPEQLVQTLPATANDPLLIELIKARNSTQADLAKLQNDYGPNHPEVLRAKKMLEEYKSEIDSRVKGILQGMEIALQSYKAQIENSRKNVEDEKSNNPSNNAKTPVLEMIRVGFICPDEKSAAMAVQQAREYYIGRTNYLVEGRPLYLFDLLSKSHATGYEDWHDELQATVNVSPTPSRPGVSSTSANESNLSYSGNGAFPSVEAGTPAAMELGEAVEKLRVLKLKLSRLEALRASGKATPEEQEELGKVAEEEVKARLLLKRAEEASETNN